ncbi:MAG: GTPase HflX [Nitrospinota bacterium]|nr:GTPase HflX [Nitrospinota bacterium]
MNPTINATRTEILRGGRAILMGVHLGNHKSSSSLEDSLKELEGLALTAYYSPLTSITQRVSTINPKTLIGKGKVEELQREVKTQKADLVIFDDSLSPAQNRNLENELHCRVIDRSWLILEIFGDHARTREAKTQVELAKLKYALPRLTRMWGHLSRQRGGIGMRDVGETQIQLDRRMIRDHISKLEKKLKKIDREKSTQRKSRQGAYRVTLVGYTNAGKSTLMNYLTGAETLVENKLFATLDSTIRKIRKNFPYPILLADTVGLIDKLPHDLVASFKSTLDEVRESDLLLKMVDASHPNFRNHLKTTDELLKEMAMDKIDSIPIFNQIDRIQNPDLLQEITATNPDAVLISCKTGEGIDRLRNEITHFYEENLTAYRLDLEYSKSDLIPEIRKHAFIVREDYKENIISLSLRFPLERKNKLDSILNGQVRRTIKK